MDDDRSHALTPSARPPATSQLLDRIEDGDARALSRAITAIENRAPECEALLRALYPKSGRAAVVGITGSPGSGKSTLVDRLAAAYAASQRRVGVVAVDPSSPYSGGAILGDRIRMSDLEENPDVFVRSMATRGRLGGLAGATADVVTVLDAAGRDPVIVETVGVGQDEVDVVRLADVSVVVLVPGMGDDVQAMKAGILEIGDVFVINKCDRPGVDALERALRAMFALDESVRTPDAPIVRTIATDGRGIDELRDAIDRRGGARDAPPERARRRRAARARLTAVLEERLARLAHDHLLDDGEFEAAVDAVERRERDPYSVVDEVLGRFRFGRAE